MLLKGIPDPQASPHSASSTSWSKKLSSAILPHGHDVLLNARSPRDYGLDPLKLWAQGHPSSLALFMLGMLVANQCNWCKEQTVCLKDCHPTEWHGRWRATWPFLGWRMWTNVYSTTQNTNNRLMIPPWWANEFIGLTWRARLEGPLQVPGRPSDSCFTAESHFIMADNRMETASWHPSFN